MATQKQIAANRRNAQKSTGPVSPAGKTVSSQNALQSGIHAEAEIIRGESSADLAALRDEYYAAYSPANPAERAFADILIHSEWLLRRLRRVEAELFAYRISVNSDFSGYDPAAAVGEAFDSDNRTYDRLQRRLNSLQRNFERALKSLQTLQSARIQAASEELASFRPDPAPAPAGPRPLPSPAAALPQLLPAAPPEAAISAPVADAGDLS